MAVVLTSRKSSWNQQLVINGINDSDQVGELQPLRYPNDVEPFIRRWFVDQPEWDEDLAAQIARRPSLQLAATVPLILAFYCLIGGQKPMPDFRRDVYTKVLKRLLTGRWRDNDDSRPDVDDCLQMLRAWAWSGVISSNVSGIGTWADDVSTGRAGLGAAEMDALVVCKSVCFSLGTLDLAEDLVGVFGPGERVRVVVPVIDERADGVGELAY